MDSPSPATCLNISNLLFVTSPADQQASAGYFLFFGVLGLPWSIGGESVAVKNRCRRLSGQKIDKGGGFWVMAIGDYPDRINDRNVAVGGGRSHHLHLSCTLSSGAASESVAVGCCIQPPMPRDISNVKADRTAKYRLFMALPVLC